MVWWRLTPRSSRRDGRRHALSVSTAELVADRPQLALLEFTDHAVDARRDRRAMGGDPAEEEVSIVMFGRF
jgi:hypothetical protein